jgi:hypothetical protein
MALKQGDDLLDERVTRRERQLTRVEQLWSQIRQKQREIRLLELELARTDPNELAKENYSENEIQRSD